jgi:trimeric autotransporter adhesin
MRHSKRSFDRFARVGLCGFSMLMAVWCVLGAWPGSTRAEKAPPPIAAQAFLDTIGVNVHMAYSWTSYRDEKLVLRALDYVGIRHLRDVLAPWEVARPKYEHMAAAGKRFDLVIPVDKEHADVPTFVRGVASLQQRFPGSVAAVEGPNEINIWKVRSGALTGPAAGAQVQKDIFAAVRAEPRVKDVPVYNLTLAYTDERQYRELGAMAPPADFANAHSYAWSWGTPTEAMPYIVGFAELLTPDKPMVITETGYTTLASDPYSGVDEAAQAVRLVQTLLDAYSLNVKRTYLYELLDLNPDPDLNDAQRHFGMFRYDGTPKPAATAIRNLINVLKQPDGKNYGNAEAASVSIDSPNETFAKSMMFRRADGAKCLLLWYESPTSDKDRRPVKELTKT